MYIYPREEELVRYYMSWLFYFIDKDKEIKENINSDKIKRLEI